MHLANYRSQTSPTDSTDEPGHADARNASETGGNSTPADYNVRKTWLPHWRHWLDVANRRVVPATAFCEYSQTPDRETQKKPKIWFAIDESQPLFFFAGIWTNWSGVRGSMKTPRPGDHSLFAFLTCNPNGIVAPIHPQAMPVILTCKDEIETWLTADWKEAKALQRPLPDDGLTIVSRAETAVAGQGSLFG